MLNGWHRLHLTPMESLAWWYLYALASQCPRLGRIERDPGFPYDLQEIAEQIRMDEDVTKSVIRKALKLGTMHTDELGALVISEWDQKQHIGTDKYQATKQTKKIRRKVTYIQEEEEIDEEVQGILPVVGHKIIDMPSSDGGKGTQNPVVRLMEEIEAETENY